MLFLGIVKPLKKERSHLKDLIKGKKLKDSGVYSSNYSGVVSLIYYIFN